jgi:GTPase involved in cell partitioning and DNA repair
MSTTSRAPQGAHAGAGLGQEFLRHAERARTFIHLLDGTSTDPGHRNTYVTNNSRLGQNPGHGVC